MTEALASGLAPPVGGLRDVRAAVRRAQTGAALAAEELAEIASVLRAVGDLDRWLGRISDQFPRLGAMKEQVGEFSGLVNTIDGCLDERARVLDTASRRLSAIRREIGAAEERIQETLRRLLRSPEIRRILRYPNFTMVGHHYVLPIAKDHRGEIAGSVHRTSASNETVFIEPQAIAEQSAQLSYLRAKEQKEVRRVLRWLSAQVGQVADLLLMSLEALADLDLVHGQGRYSLDFRMAPPDFNEEGRIALRSARHPLLEALFRSRRGEGRAVRDENLGLGGETTNLADSPLTPEPSPLPDEVVPIDVTLGYRANILVITGPNTGGKTVAIKTVALLAVMAQCGLHIPAGEGSLLPVFDQVLADIGDEQSLEQSLSTFSSHIRRIREVFATATEHSLVILDELGAGTDPTEGAALGRAILDELDSIGCRAIVTTHIGDLKTYAFSNPRAENAAVEFDLESLRPLYRLRIGDIGQSNALLIARRLDLAEHLVARAEGYLSQAKSHELPEWEVIARLRKDAEAAQHAALEAQAEAERVREALSRKLTDLQVQESNESRLAEARARLQPGDRVVVPRFGYDRPGRIVRLDPRKGTAQVAIGMMKWDVPIAELVPQLARGPELTESPEKGRPPRNAPRLEDFGDE
jgi:DNA mismatch repair protein MutS2